MNSKSNLNKLGAKKSHRVALMKNLVSDLIIYEHLTTSKAKANQLLSEFDTVVKVAKTDTNRRELERKLSPLVGNNLAITKLIDVFVKRFGKETSGLVNHYKLQPRKGDGSERVKLIVKGYVYKDIGKKIGTIKKKDEVKANNKFENENKKSASQVVGNISTSTVKSRSGI